MDRTMQKEYQEVIVAAEQVLTDIDGALDQLQRARRWSRWDMWGDEFLAGWLKRQRMADAEGHLTRLRTHLKDLSNELADVDRQPFAQMDFSFGREFWDLFFDNIFTDYKVHQEIKEAIADLEKLRSEMKQLVLVAEKIVQE